jgi:Ca-activated chloride channel family protein
VAGRHNTISVDAPQGFLYVRTKRGNAYDQEQLLVRRAGDQELINVQEIGTLEKYLVGSYDLVIPIYPVMEVHGLEISQSNTTTVEIPAPGYVTFNTGQPGAGTLYQMNASGEQKWVVNLRENARSQSYYLQPGKYRVVFRRDDHKSSSYTMVKDFTVKEGKPESIKFY